MKLHVGIEMLHKFCVAASGNLIRLLMTVMKSGETRIASAFKEVLENGCTDFTRLASTITLGADQVGEVTLL